MQVDKDRCIIDGTVDGLAPGLHGLHIHELGDLSDGCNRLAYCSHLWPNKSILVFISSTTSRFLKILRSGKRSD